MRIGYGFDAHRFITGRKLVLGGVEVAYDRGLDAHSDGDVVIHALIDALLGAAGQGDIGKLFPDTDPAFRDIQSRILLRKVKKKLEAEEYRLSNVDITIVAQVPKLSSFISKMESRIAQDLGVDASRINVKATTTEGLGFAGRSEGIAAHAAVLIDRLV